MSQFCLGPSGSAHQLRRRGALAVAVLGLAVAPGSTFACAACYGQSDSPLAAGMNWGIFSLLVVIVCVLGGIAASFVVLARRAAAHAALAAASGRPRIAHARSGIQLAGSATLAGNPVSMAGRELLSGVAGAAIRPSCRQSSKEHRWNR